VVLYELLTGATPLDCEMLNKSALDEMQRLIREAEPPKPSTRLRTLGKGLDEVAKHRQAEPTALPRLVHGDLDWIVMKCLEKDRGRRYDTAAALAQDLQNHLNHQPVMASPPSASYRLRKFLRRHRTAMFAGTAVGLALVLGLALALDEFIEARRERDRALAAEQLAEQHRAEAQKEAQRSSAVMGLLWRMFAGHVRWGKTFTQEQILDEFCADLTNYPVEDPEVMAQVEGDIAGAYRDLGSSKAREHAARALALRRQAFGPRHLKVAESLWLMACESGPEEGEALVNEGISICRQFAPQSGLLAGLLGTRSDFQRIKGRFGAARKDLDEALKIAEKLSDHQEDLLAGTYGELGLLANSMTNLDEAEVWLRRSKEASRKTPRPGCGWGACSTFMLGIVLMNKGNNAEAEQYLREGLADYRLTYGDDHPSARAPLSFLRRLLRGQGRSESELERLWSLPAVQVVNSTNLPSVAYRLRIQTPGDYQLWLRWYRYDLRSDNIYAQIPELNDGPGGAAADAWCFTTRSSETNADRAREPAWMGIARFECVDDGEASVPAVWKISKPGDYTLRLVTGRPGAAVDGFALQLTSLAGPKGVGPLESEKSGDGAFVERDGRLVVDAAHFSSRVAGKEFRWLAIPREGADDDLHLDHRGTDYLQARP
jgi:tetratricopeptide (TPR) repeat protein